MASVLKHFRASFLFTFLGLVLAFWLGYSKAQDITQGFSTLFIVGLLGVLETSLSFDNAVVNATVLQNMDALWRKRFLTWGMLIAVFGMRIVFPLAIVSILGQLNPLETFWLALENPKKYADILSSSHVALSGFGGAFLLLVALKYFFDVEKNEFWIAWVERPLSRIGKLDTIEIAVTLLVIVGIAWYLPEEKEMVNFLMAGIFGIITFIGVEGLGAIFETPTGSSNSDEKALKDNNPALMTAQVGLSSFIYLEILDASFSFDGVIGAFALSDNIFVIAVGLGIGAMFVRSLTILLVEEGTLAQFRFLENGAFFAIWALAIIMLASSTQEIPEVVTGLIGATFIGLSLLSSVKHNRKVEALALQNEVQNEALIQELR
jgi:uncharacterized protein